MSKSLNKVILIGNLGADPEVRSTANGGRVATVSLATGRQWRGQDGSRQEKTEWHRVIAWNNTKGAGTGLADVVEKYCKKGDKLYVEGEIEYRSWQDKDGQTKYTTEIRARELILLSGRGEGGGESGGWSGGRSGGGAAASRPASGGNKSASFDDLPESLDAEDDDLPF